MALRRFKATVCVMWSANRQHSLKVQWLKLYKVTFCQKPGGWKTTRRRHSIRHGCSESKAAIHKEVLFVFRNQDFYFQHQVVRLVCSCNGSQLQNPASISFFQLHRYCKSSHFQIDSGKYPERVYTHTQITHTGST